jgi:hypothetical protein
VFQQYPGQQMQQQGYAHHPPPPGYAEPYRDNMQSTLEASHAEWRLTGELVTPSQS